MCGESKRALGFTGGDIRNKPVEQNPLLTPDVDGWNIPGRDAARGLYPGMVLGAYVIEKFLAEGGMSKVFLARRKDHPEWKVAIKRLKSNEPEIVARFQKECKILAGFNHNNIAKVMDVGITESGFPWLAMEYVDGLNLIDWCEEHKLTVRERIVLLIRVCDALSYAHRNLVIHRDLKPGNILVDRHGEPKLIDFGIASIIDARTGEQHTNTLFCGAMTPRYASPEQIRGESLGTTTDVYSLGVILFELLCGSSPYPVNPKNLVQVGDAILNRDVRPMSSVVGKHLSGEPETGESPQLFWQRMSRSRGLSPAMLRKRLSGDLDNIANKALARHITDRYASVESLRYDLTRYLSGKPVLARQASRAYRMRKFVTRNRKWVTAAAVSLCVLVGFTAALFQQVKATAKERDRALQEHAMAEQVVSFLEDMFRTAIPGANGSVESFLLEGKHKLTSNLNKQPARRSRLLLTLSHVYQNRADFEEAEKLLVEAENLARDEGNDRELLARILLARASLFQELGELKRVDPLLKEIKYIAMSSESPHLTAESMVLEAGQLRLSGHYQRGLEVLEEALSMPVVTRPGDGELLIDAYDKKADLLFNLGRYREAETTYRYTLARIEEFQGPTHVDTAHVTVKLAEALVFQGRGLEALALGRESLETQKSVYGEKHPRIGAAYDGLGRIHLKMKQYEESRDSFQKALDLFTDTLPADSMPVGRVTHNLGLALVKLNRLDQAESLLRRSLAMFRNHRGMRHPNHTEILASLALCLQEKGDSEVAADLLKEALSFRKETSPGHPRLAGLMNNLSYVYCYSGDLESAKAWVKQAIEHQLAHGREQTPATALFYRNLGAYEFRSDNFDAAVTSDEKGLRLLEDLEMHTSVQYPSLMVELAHARWRKGHEKQAEKLAVKAMNLFSENFGEDHLQYGVHGKQIGEFYSRAGEPEKGLALLKKVLPILERVHGHDSQMVLHTRYWMAKCVQEMEDYPRALSLFTSLYPRLTEVYGVEHVVTQATIQRIIDILDKQGSHCEADNFRKQLLPEQDG
ncbi:MAG: serine/threonine-protein kinase [Acidobacteriota bacterium]|nr:serine/threonine-protein kinase [Acidobacteriota bacterium]